MPAADLLITDIAYSRSSINSFGEQKPKLNAGGISIGRALVLRLRIIGFSAIDADKTAGFLSPPTTNRAPPATSSSGSVLLMAALVPTSLLNLEPLSAGSPKKFGWDLELGRIANSMQRKPCFKVKGTRRPTALTEEFRSGRQESIREMERGDDLFDQMKDRFLRFKKQNYMENLNHFQDLAKGQEPKFMVIACADSRVCPSTILGFQPGEAFMVRNIANLVPPYESGPSEVKAALEFSVNTLRVENILVTGHSCCGGIRALMSMNDEADSSFIKSWVTVGKNARLITEAAAPNLSFDLKCRHCEKESVNCSLLNLLSYPWIEEKVKSKHLFLHGGYYDFTNCTYEKWTLDYSGSISGEGKRAVVKDRSVWA